MKKDDALASLEAVNRAKARLAADAKWPFWRHAAYGLIEAAIVLSVSLPFSALLAVAGGAIIATLLVIKDDKRRYGMFISGWQGGKPRLVTLGMVAFIITMFALSFTTRGQPFPAPIAVGAALATFIACTIGSYWWQKLYREELGHGAA